MAKLINSILISFFGAVFLLIAVKFIKLVYLLIKKKKPKPEPGEKKESKTFSFLIAIVGAVIAFILNVAIEEIKGFSFPHSLILEYEYVGENISYDDLISSDIESLQNRIESLGYTYCDSKYNKNQIAILYEGPERIPKYIVDTPEQIRDTKFTGDDMEIFEKWQVSKDLRVKRNVFLPNKYSKFPSEPEPVQTTTPMPSAPPAETPAATPETTTQPAPTVAIVKKKKNKTSQTGTSSVKTGEHTIGTPTPAEEEQIAESNTKQEVQASIEQTAPPITSYNPVPPPPLY